MSVLEPLTLQVQLPQVQPGRTDSRRGQQRPAVEGGKAPEKGWSSKGKAGRRAGEAPLEGWGGGVRVGEEGWGCRTLAPTSPLELGTGVGRGK